MTYIAGKVSGDKDYVHKFMQAERKLATLSHRLFVNPARIVKAGTGWRCAMKDCLAKLIDCQEIILLPDWWQSRGAWVEFLLAKVLGIRVVSYKQALQGGDV